MYTYIIYIRNVILESERERVEGASFSHLDIFTKQVGVETEPVPGDVESSLQQDVSLQRTRIHYRRRRSRYTGDETERDPQSLIKWSHPSVLETG